MNSQSMAGHGLGDVITESNGELVFQVASLKTKTKQDYARRLIYIQLLASERLLGQQFQTREQLGDLLRDHRVEDGNTRAILASDPYLRRVGEGSDAQISLMTESRKSAEQFVQEILDPGVVVLGEYLPGRVSRSTTAKKKDTGSAAPGGSSASKKPTTEPSGSGAQKPATGRRLPHGSVAKWAAALPGAGFDKDSMYALLEPRPDGEQALVALFAISKVASGERAISTKVMESILRQAWVIKAPERTIERDLKALAKEPNARVHHVEGTRFELTPAGEKWVSSLLTS